MTQTDCDCTPTTECQACRDKAEQEIEAGAWWLSQDVSPDGLTAISYVR
jgi:hypothetical protein